MSNYSENINNTLENTVAELFIAKWETPGVSCECCNFLDISTAY